MQRKKKNLFTRHTHACKSDEPGSISCGQACCAVCWSPSEEPFHAVKQTVVSVWPFQWGTFSSPQNTAKKQDVNLETKRKKRADKCHHYATISAGTARPTPNPHTRYHNHYHSAAPSDMLAPMCNATKNKHINRANGIAKARINAVSLLELWFKVIFFFCWHISALGCCTNCDEISQTIFIKALKFNVLSKGGKAHFFLNIGESTWVISK